MTPRYQEEYERDEWIRLRANYLELHGPDEFPRGYYEHVAGCEWDEDLLLGVQP